MKTNFLIMCDNAYLDENKKLNINGVFDAIFSPGFPAINKGMFVVVNFELPEGPHVEFTKIKKGSWEIKTPKTPITKERSGKHQFIHNFSNIVFPEEGEYSVEVYVDSQLIASDILHIIKKA